MPYPNEHAARIHDPGRYKKIRRENDKFGAGVDVLWGITEDGKVEIQAIHFDAKRFTPEEARAWLKAHDYSAGLEAATGGERAARALRLLGATGLVRTAQDEVDGTERLVVPVVALVEGVIWAVNAETPELVLADELAIAPEGWNGRPVVVDHPNDGRGQVSANSPSMLARHAIGQVFHAHLANGALTMEAWLDPRRAQRIGPKAEAIVRSLQAGEMIEVSVGCFVVADPQKGEHKGQPYQAVWRQIVPDHLAFLSAGQIGACSNAQGCGAPRTAVAHVVQADGSLRAKSAAADPTPGKERHAMKVDSRLTRLTMRVAAAPGEQDVAMLDRLSSALAEAVPEFGGIEGIFPVARAVVYQAGPADAQTLQRQSFSLLEDGAIALAGDAEPVEAIVSYEPRAARDVPTSEREKMDPEDFAGPHMSFPIHKPEDVAAAAHSLGRAGGDQDAIKAKIIAIAYRKGPAFVAQLPETWKRTAEEKAASAAADTTEPDGAAATSTTTQEPQPPCGCTTREAAMTKEAREEAIKTLVACKHSGFTAEDQPMLEAAPDARLESFLVAAEARKQEVEKAKEPKQLTEEEFMRMAPPSLKALVQRQQRQETETKTELVTALKSAQEEYSEAELASMSIDQLSRIARLAGLEARPNYEGRGLPRAAAGKDDVFANPPDPYALALAARKAN